MTKIDRQQQCAEAAGQGSELDRLRAEVARLEGERDEAQTQLMAARLDKAKWGAATAKLVERAKEANDLRAQLAEAQARMAEFEDENSWLAANRLLTEINHAAEDEIARLSAQLAEAQENITYKRESLDRHELKVKQLRRQDAEAKAEAVALWESLPHDCETLPTTAGIITQINNWCAGALVKLAAAQADSERLRQELAAQAYMGNSISYIYDKMRCYQNQVGFAFAALRHLGWDGEGKDNTERELNVRRWAEDLRVTIDAARKAEES